jgi:hypothetical protein
MGKEPRKREDGTRRSNTDRHGKPVPQRVMDVSTSINLTENK